MLKVAVDLENSTDFDISTTVLETHLSEILNRLHRQQPNLISDLRLEKRADTVKAEISIVGDKTIQALNHRFLGKDRPTDVLSFAAPTEAEHLPLGSIIISKETAAKQAAEAGISLHDEIKMLAGHGFLHLLGFDHR